MFRCVPPPPASLLTHSMPRCTYKLVCTPLPQSPFLHTPCRGAHTNWCVPPSPSLPSYTLHAAVHIQTGVYPPPPVSLLTHSMPRCTYKLVCTPLPQSPFLHTPCRGAHTNWCVPPSPSLPSYTLHAAVHIQTGVYPPPPASLLAHTNWCVQPPFLHTPCRGAHTNWCVPPSPSLPSYTLHAAVHIQTGVYPPPPVSLLTHSMPRCTYKLVCTPSPSLPSYTLHAAVHIQTGVYPPPPASLLTHSMPRCTYKLVCTPLPQPPFLHTPCRGAHTNWCVPPSPSLPSYTLHAAVHIQTGVYPPPPASLLTHSMPRCTYKLVCTPLPQPPFLHTPCRGAHTNWCVPPSPSLPSYTLHAAVHIQTGVYPLPQSPFLHTPCCGAHTNWCVPPPPVSLLTHSMPRCTYKLVCTPLPQSPFLHTPCRGAHTNWCVPPSPSLPSYTLHAAVHIQTGVYPPPPVSLLTHSMPRCTYKLVCTPLPQSPFLHTPCRGAHTNWCVPPSPSLPSYTLHAAVQVVSFQLIARGTTDSRSGGAV